MNKVALSIDKHLQPFYLNFLVARIRQITKGVVHKAIQITIHIQVATGRFINIFTFLLSGLLR